MNNKYIIRENTDFKLITKEEQETNSTKKLLEQEYPYILQSMKKEKYKIEYDDFDLLQEIIYENKVVGIISMINIEALNHTICINEIYILPEHRQQGLFIENIINLLSQPNITLAFRNPSKKIISLLVKHGFALKLENNLVISYVDIFVDNNNNYENKQIRDYYANFDKHKDAELIKTNIYDLNIDSSVFFDIDNIIKYKENPIYIEKARLTDSNNEKYYQKLKNMDLVYLDTLSNRILSAVGELNEFYKVCDDRINDYLNLDTILGTEEELTPLFIQLLKKYDLSQKEGFIIRKQVLKALKEEEIIPKSIVLRTVYLMKNYPHKKNVDKNVELGKDIIEKCPYCKTLNYSILEVCRECGYNIQRNNHFEENLPEIISENFLLNQIIPECQIQENIDYTENKLNDDVYDEFYYMDFDKNHFYELQCKLATYQLLKAMEDIVYFDIFDYDSLNSIRRGSAFNYAKDNNYIEDLKDYTLYYDLMDMTFSKKELKRILNRNNIDTDGTKKELLNRIKTQLTPIETFGKRYVLTDKGEEYLDEHRIYDYFLDNLSGFLFGEFIEFTKIYYGSFDDLAQAFLDYVEDIAIEYKDYFKYHKIIEHKLQKTAEKDSDEYLVLFTQLFIIELNYWLNSKEHEPGDKPLDIDVILEYPEIKNYFMEKDITEIFNEAHSSIKIDYLKEHEDISLFYLIKSLEYDDIDDINREIEIEKYDEEYIRSLID